MPMKRRPVQAKGKIANPTLDSPSFNNKVMGWVLMLPFIFFTVRGTFSFLEGAMTSMTGGGDLAGLVSTRDRGPLGYIIFPGIAYSIVLWVVLVDIKRVLALAWQMKMLSLLALTTMLSAAWSQNPVRSLYNGAFYLLGTLFAFALVLRFRPKEIGGLIMRNGVFICLLGLIVILLYPQYGLYNLEARTASAWRGLFIDRTSAAKAITYLLSPALVFGDFSVSLPRIAFILLLCVSIVKAKAVTALVVLFLYVLIMIALQITRRLDRGAALAVGSIVIPGGIASVYFGIPLVGEVLAYFGRDLSLSGRVGIWGPIINSIAKHPLLGYGFYSFWLGLTGESANIVLATHWVFGYAHNGMLEILLQLGFFGLTIFLITFIQAVKDASYCFRHSRSTEMDWYMGIIVLAVLYNVDEATVVFPNDLLSMLYVLACCGLSVTARRLKGAQKPAKGEPFTDVRYLSLAR